MVYIEFYDKDQIENICSSLASTPDKVYLIGDNRKNLERHAIIFSEIFSERGKNIEFISKSINKNSINDIIIKIEEIVENETDVYIDLTGGDELFLVAVGIIFSKHSEKNIQMHRFNIRNNTILDCDCDGKTISCVPAPKLSITENIKLYGGAVITECEGIMSTHNWNIDDELADDIKLMWLISQSDEIKSCWNAQINLLQVVGKYSEIQQNGTEYEILSDTINNVLAKSAQVRCFCSDFIKIFNRYGLLKIEQNGQRIKVKYKNENIKRCLEKSGQILEMMTYVLMLEAMDDEGERVYSDVMTGVCIDWDAVNVFDKDTVYTKNEIDVIAMHNMVPVFISCKNGQVEMEELYKLNTVANKFGGKYSKKVIVVTSLSDDTASMGFRQRARDMGIEIVEPDDVEIEEFEKKLKKLWK